MGLNLYKATNEADDIIIFGKSSDPSIPQTRPGPDGKVSCSCSTPSEGIWNSFGREPTPNDMYWQVDVEAVTSNGGQVIHDAGLPVIDIAGNPMGGKYPVGHVSLSFPGQSKGWVERNLLKWLSEGKKVIAN